MNNLIFRWIYEYFTAKINGGSCGTFSIPVPGPTCLKRFPSWREESFFSSLWPPPSPSPSLPLSVTSDSNQSPGFPPSIIQPAPLSAPHPSSVRSASLSLCQIPQRGVCTPIPVHRFVGNLSGDSRSVPFFNPRTALQVFPSSCCPAIIGFIRSFVM